MIPFRLIRGRRTAIPSLKDGPIPGFDFLEYLGIRSISLRSRAPGALTVGTTQLKDAAVITAKIADEAVTTIKAAAPLKTTFYLGDETEVTGTPVAYTTRKDLKLVRGVGGTGLIWGSMKTIYELRRPVGSAGSVRARYLLNATTVFESPYVNSGTYSLRIGTFRIGQFAGGSPIPFNVQLRSSATTASAKQRLLELYAQQR